MKRAVSAQKELDGFLAKYLNALELVAFLAFLLIVPSRRRWLLKPHFWLMLVIAALCCLPVFWWNAQHGWITALHVWGDAGMTGHANAQLTLTGHLQKLVADLLFLRMLNRSFPGWRKRGKYLSFKPLIKLRLTLTSL